MISSMEIAQNKTETKLIQDERDAAVQQAEEASWKHEQYIAYTAFGGLIPDPNGEATAVKMTAQQFADQIGMSRSILYEWRDTIPNFWERVDAKRREMGGKDRLSKVWNGIFLKAASGNAEAAKLYLANFDPNFKMPSQKIEHEAGDSLVDALTLARNRRQVIEGDTVDASDNIQA